MQPLSKTNLAENATEAIRSEILSKRWAVGDKLPNEAALSAMLSVSRGTIREAVRVLASQGLLETRQGSGTYVLSTTDTALPLTMARRAGKAQVPQSGPVVDWQVDHYTLVESKTGDGSGYTVLREYR